MSQGKMDLKFDPQTKISLQRYTRNDHTTALPVQVGNIQILMCKIQFLTDSPGLFSCLIRLLLPTESNDTNIE